MTCNGQKKKDKLEYIVAWIYRLDKSFEQLSLDRIGGCE